MVRYGKQIIFLSVYTYNLFRMIKSSLMLCHFASVSSVKKPQHFWFLVVTTMTRPLAQPNGKKHYTLKAKLSCREAVDMGHRYKMHKTFVSLNLQ
jgi:hypothetical protein